MNYCMVFGNTTFKEYAQVLKVAHNKSKAPRNFENCTYKIKSCAQPGKLFLLNKLIIFVQFFFKSNSIVIKYTHPPV